MPNEKLVGGWAAQTPSPYKLTLKAPRRITHDSRLKNCGELVRAFCGVAGTLGDKLGALLFQLPPNLKKDLALFDAFLDELPPKAPRRVRVPPPVVARRRGVRAADGTEPRALRRRQREDVDAGAVTADYAYFRLRDEGYTPADIARWADDHCARDERVPRCVRLLQARRRREGTGVRAAADRCSSLERIDFTQP